MIGSKASSNIAIFDAGTGIRALGKDLEKQGHIQPEYHLILSHFHWDHIQGFPFFSYAYKPDQKIKMIAMGKRLKISSLRQIFMTQLQQEFFPVQLDNMGAEFEFIQPPTMKQKFVNATVTVARQNHPGGSYGYRFEYDNHVLVICTDVEHRNKIDERIVKLADGADILVHDAQYTKEELVYKRGWGHSSCEQAMEVAERANVKQLILTHHDPDHDDEFLRKIEKKCQDRFKDTLLAREKMEVSP